MAEGIAREGGWESCSAGTKPEIKVNPFAVNVMAEMGIDISHHIPQSVNEYLTEDFYLVATVCDNAKEKCPIFTGRCEHKIHHGFIDPANATGYTDDAARTYERLPGFINVFA